MKTIRPAQLQVLIETDEPVEIIDVRPRSAFATLHASASHSLPLSELSLASLIAWRRLPLVEPLYLLCDNGSVAARAAVKLAGEGFTNAVVVEGGLDAWRDHGLPVSVEPGSATWRYAV